MKHMKTVQVPSKTKYVVDFLTCDVCGAKIPDGGSYDVDEVEVRHKTGENFPEGGSGIETRIDMCGKCFDEKLVPWLRTQGANPDPEPWYW